VRSGNRFDHRDSCDDQGAKGNTFGERFGHAVYADNPGKSCPKFFLTLLVFRGTISL